MEKIEISSDERNQFIDITSRVQQIVHGSDIEKGSAFIYCPHTTGAITINEGADPAVKRDISNALKKLVPNVDFQHMEGNSDAHFKSSLVGPSEEVPVENKKIKLGRWQKIYFCEFDGPRSRNVWIYTREQK